MQPQTIKLALPLGAWHVTWGLFTSESFLQMYIRLFFPITIWLSSLSIQLFHSPSTVQFFLSLAQATRFFLFTSLTTTCFFSTRCLYSKSVGFRWTVFALKVWSLPSFMMVVMSWSGLLSFCFTTRESWLMSLSVNSLSLPLPPRFSTEPDSLNFFFHWSYCSPGYPKNSWQFW